MFFTHSNLSNSQFDYIKAVDEFPPSETSRRNSLPSVELWSYLCPKLCKMDARAFALRRTTFFGGNSCWAEEQTRRFLEVVESEIVFWVVTYCNFLCGDVWTVAFEAFCSVESLQKRNTNLSHFASLHSYNYSCFFSSWRFLMVRFWTLVPSCFRKHRKRQTQNSWKHWLNGPQTQAATWHVRGPGRGQLHQEG